MRLSRRATSTVQSLGMKSAWQLYRTKRKHSTISPALFFARGAQTKQSSITRKSSSCILRTQMLTRTLGALSPQKETFAMQWRNARGRSKLRQKMWLRLAIWHGCWLHLPIVLCETEVRLFDWLNARSRRVPGATITQLFCGFWLLHTPRLVDLLMLKRRLSRRCKRLRSEEHTSELQSQSNLVCRLL